MSDLPGWFEAPPNHPCDQFPWKLFVLTYVVFCFAQPYTLFWTLANSARPDETYRIMEASKGVLGREIGLPLLALLSAYLLIKRKGGRPLVVGLPGFLVIFFFAWAWMSLAWSVNTLFTVKKLLVFTCLWLSATAIGARLSREQLVLFIVIATLSTLIISLFNDVVSGVFLPLSPDYRFAGVMHPNDQAVNCGLLLLSSAAMTKIAPPESRRRYICLCFTAFLFLVLTKSRTALISSMVACALFLAMSMPRRRLGKALSFFAFVSPFIIAAFYGLSDKEVLSAAKDALLLGRITEVGTFTGRVPMWELLGKYVLRHPWLGVGYDSFWTPERMARVMGAEGAWVASTHSSYFNVVLGLGGVGLAVFACILLFAFVKSIGMFRGSHDAALACSAAVLLMMSINIALETVWFDPGFTGFLGMIVLARLAFVEHDPGSSAPYQSLEAIPQPQER